ncbi:hypothetical protein NFI96_007896 [Prochilodus magdalenae]|nr:hypothetical protein NFI96_007896 [Prochilodus magdalenae]
MVWGWHFLGGQRPPALHVLARGSLTAIRYRDEILRPLVGPYAGAVGPGLLLMQDNARPHVAGVFQQFLQDEGIEAMDWPARSPDLNPIEHIWDIMSRSIHQRHVAPLTVQELADALVQVWEEIPQETIHHLIRSIPSSQCCSQFLTGPGFSKSVSSFSAMIPRKAHIPSRRTYTVLTPALYRMMFTRERA